LFNFAVAFLRNTYALFGDIKGAIRDISQDQIVPASFFILDQSFFCCMKKALQNSLTVWTDAT